MLEDAAATAIAVLTNDTDVDGGPEPISAASDPANGTVVITGGGTGLTYQPDANYCNSPPGTTLDTFTYTLTPGGSTATVSVTVTCVNDPPVAGDDSFTGANAALANTRLVVGTTSTGPNLTVAGQRPHQRHRSRYADRTHRRSGADLQRQLCRLQQRDDGGRRQLHLRPARRVHRHRHVHLHRQRQRPRSTAQPDRHRHRDDRSRRPARVVRRHRRRRATGRAGWPLAQPVQLARPADHRHRCRRSRRHHLPRQR